MQSSPQQPSPGKEPRKRSLFSFGTLALFAGVAAGALGVYVIESRSGNEVAGNCPVDDQLKARIDAAARGEVAAMVAMDAPFDATALAFKDADGVQTSIGAMAGQTLLVNLWATWCVPCRVEMPELDRLQAEAGSDAFAVVPINLDLGETDKPQAFYDEIGLTHLPMYRDETLKLFNDLKGNGVAFGMPVTMLVDKTGCARGVMNGPAEWAGADARALIDAFMSEGG